MGHPRECGSNVLHWRAMAEIVEAKGAVEYVAWVPFKRIMYTPPPDDPEAPPQAFETWVPGWYHEALPPYGEDSRPVWDGEGQEVRLVISVHKPGRFPPRVFYTRQWRSPEGRQFGRAGLHMTTHQAFVRWRSGERRKRLVHDERGVLKSSAEQTEGESLRDDLNPFARSREGG